VLRVSAAKLQVSTAKLQLPVCKHITLAPPTGQLSITPTPSIQPASKASMAETPADGTSAPKHSPLNSSFPVLLPYDESLFLPDAEFRAIVQKAIADARKPQLDGLKDEHDDKDNGANYATGLKRRVSGESDEEPVKKAPFIAGLEKHQSYLRTEDVFAAWNQTFTANSDVTNISSKNPLVDLFYDLDESSDATQLKTLLENAWASDPLLTLKIVFNARSIHLGKSDKIAAYKAFGWLAENHPITLLTNLSWLVRPVIEKKAWKATDAQVAGQKTVDVEMREGDAKETTKIEEDDFDMIDASEATTSDVAKTHDVRFGVSHGYWKDLLNLVVFAVNDQLKFDGDPASLLCQQQDKSKGAKRTRVWDSQEAKDLRKKKNEERYQRVVDKLRHDSFYRALHYTVARLFAQQLKEDGELLKSGRKSDLRNLSLAGKWSPTFGEFHDKHTFILSSIAEILFPNAADVCLDASNREIYLRHARELFRRNYASPLRKALAVVERDIAAQTFGDINYERVPSLAMNRYASLFQRKDYEHFSDYVEKVAKGQAKISGATLLPSTLVHKARQMRPHTKINKANFAQVKASVKAEMTRKLIDGQWYVTSSYKSAL
jgi:hypothetical protein